MILWLHQQVRWLLIDMVTRAPNVCSRSSEGCNIYTNLTLNSRELNKQQPLKMLLSVSDHLNTTLMELHTLCGIGQHDQSSELGHAKNKCRIMCS